MSNQPSTVVNFVTKSELLAERRLRKESAARLRELQDKLRGKPQHQKMVPHEAMHSEKERRRALEARIKELEAEAVELRSRLADDAR